jgi:hypothetical protein
MADSSNNEHRLPNLNNYTAQGIVDLCGPNQEELRWLDRLTKYLKTGLHARLTDEHKVDPLTWLIVGDEYTATITAETYQVFSQEEARKYMSPEQFDLCFRSQERKVVRFTKHPEEKK